MIRCLPSSPEKAWVTRMDWMISLTLRLAESSVTAEPSSVRRRWRTSCWVIVEAPRARPRIASTPAPTMPTGSKPALSQKLASSIGGRRVDEDGRELARTSTTSRLNSPNRASSALCSRSQMIDRSGSSIRSSMRRVGEALGELGVPGDGDARPDDAEDEERGEQHEAHAGGGADARAAPGRARVRR